MCFNFTGKGFHKTVQAFSEKAMKQSEGTVTDTLNGKVCMDLGHISNISQQSLSLVLNTDGIAPFKSNVITMWPVILMIANLPPVQRALPKNLILAGLWFGKEKPNMGHFLKHIIQNIQSLEIGIICL